MTTSMIAFGPVPSRRLGRSLGINHIPPKRCTYSCVYCQVGRTSGMRTEPSQFYHPEEVLQQVQDKVRTARALGEPIDYLTFVPDGEPTLDVNLGREIELLRPLGIKIAVITNSSLLWRSDVRETLSKADWVSLKVDSTSEEVWRRINRPEGTLQLDPILEGMIEFAGAYEGKLATETMLVREVNDSEEDVRQTGVFVAQLRPAVTYLSIPTRLPAEGWVRPPDADVVLRSYQALSEHVENVEYLIGYEGTEFASTGNVASDLLSITSVHPMREDAVGEMLRRASDDWPTVRHLVDHGQLVAAEYEGKTFYMRNLSETCTKN